MKIIIFYNNKKKIKKNKKKIKKNYRFTLYLCYSIILIVDITFATSFFKKINTFIILKVSSYKNFPTVGAKNIKIIMNFYKK